MAALPGVGPETSVAPAPPTESAGTTACAEAWPWFLTVSETAMAWPLLAVEGLAAIDASSAAGVCSRAGPAFAEADKGAPLSLSVPLALIAKESDPAEVVWNVHWQVRVDCAGMSCAGGELTSVADPLPDGVTLQATASASACPVLLTSAFKIRF